MNEKKTGELSQSLLTINHALYEFCDYEDEIFKSYNIDESYKTAGKLILDITEEYLAMVKYYEMLNEPIKEHKLMQKLVSLTNKFYLIQTTDFANPETGRVEVVKGPAPRDKVCKVLEKNLLVAKKLRSKLHYRVESFTNNQKINSLYEENQNSK